jgi:hypothetical protein
LFVCDADAMLLKTDAGQRDPSQIRWESAANLSPERIAIEDRMGVTLAAPPRTPNQEMLL